MTNYYKEANYRGGGEFYEEKLSATSNSVSDH